MELCFTLLGNGAVDVIGLGVGRWFHVLIFLDNRRKAERSEREKGW